jgi:hypothetical protein
LARSGIDPRANKYFNRRIARIRFNNGSASVHQP